MSLSVDGVWKSGVWNQTVWANGVWFEGAVISPAVTGLGGGSGYPVYGKWKRPKSVKEFLDIAMRDIYAEATAKNNPIETKERAARIVKPYAKGKAKIPDVEQVNWLALEQDVKRVEQLLALHQQLIDDEDVILLAYLEYFH